MQVVIVGTGYVGLTTGVALAYLGHRVICVDTNSEKVQKLQNGEIPFYEPYLQELLHAAQKNITFTDSIENADIDHSDVIFIAVGTPSKPDGSADMQYVQSAAEQIGAHLNSHYSVVVNKSTVPVGSTKWVNSVLAKSYSHQLHDVAGNPPFSVVSNPEFLRQGSAVFDTLFPDRIVIGADDPKAIEVLSELYRPLIQQNFLIPSFLSYPQELNTELITCDPASAEMIKYSANSYLALKISFINEIAKLASEVGADIKVIAHGIGTDRRISPQFLNAGIGWGGSCFGKDTAALISFGKDRGIEMPIIAAARFVNYQQRSWIVDKLMSELDSLDNSTVVLLGAAFKPNTDDLREAPSIDIGRGLSLLGVKVRITDPVALPNVKRCYPDLDFTYIDDPEEAAIGADAIVLVTEWANYKNIDWEKVKCSMNNPLVIDGRNFLDREKMLAMGFRYIGIGR
jgi:UDPglucose 6-dehydrogenase